MVSDDADEPESDQPASDQPKSEAPKADQPGADEPKSTEPTAQTAKSAARAPGNDSETEDPASADPTAGESSDEVVEETSESISPMAAEAEIGIMPMALGPEAAADPYVYWEVRSSAAGNPLLGGATVTLQGPRAAGASWSGTTYSVTDCTVAPCTGVDRDPDPGEFQAVNTLGGVTGMTSSTRWRLTTPALAGHTITPTGFAMAGSASEADASPAAGQWTNQGTYDFGDFIATPLSGTMTVTVRKRTTAEPTAVGGTVTGNIGSNYAGTAGAKFRLYTYTSVAAGPKAPTAFTCEITAGGECSITITGAGTTPANGGTKGNRYWVVEETSASGTYSNPKVLLGDYAYNGTTTFGPTEQRQLAGLTQEVVTGRVNYLPMTANNVTGGTVISNGELNDQQNGPISVAEGGSFGALVNSVTNPPLVPKCLQSDPLKVAVVLDQSASISETNWDDFRASLVTGSDSLLSILKNANSLVSILGFGSNVSSSSGNGWHYGGSGPAALPTNYASLIPTDRPGGTGNATNWDAALSAVQTLNASADFDLVLFITDGAPNLILSGTQVDSYQVTLRSIEAPMYAANAIKNSGTRIIAVGVGGGITGAGPNLRAISGEDKDSSYFQTSDWGGLKAQLADIANAATCTLPIEVSKTTVSVGGATATNVAGWTFAATKASGSGTITPTTPQTTTAGTAGTAKWTLAFTQPTGQTAAVTLTETTKSGWDLTDVACTVNNQPVSTTITGSAVTVSGLTTASNKLYCTFTNTEQGASVKVEKKWVVNGVTYDHGQQPSGLTANLTLTGPGTAGASAQAWNTTRSGYAKNSTTTIAETTGIAASLPGCSAITSTIRPTGSTGAGSALPYVATLSQTENNYTITNTVNCTSNLTLKKTVANGTQAANSWNLTAFTTPSDPTTGTAALSGTTGISGNVAAGTYQLAESAGSALYTQVDNRTTPLAYPLSTGSWVCTQANNPAFSGGDQGAVTIPVGANVECTATNRTAQLTLLKEVVNDHYGSATAGQWNLTATPATLAGLTATTVTGSPTASAANTIWVRPGHTYTLSEAGPSGYVGQLQKLNGSTWENVAGNQITVAALASATYRWLNDDNAAAVTASLTATPSFSRDYDWEITKSVVGASSQRVRPGNNAGFGYDVVVTPSGPFDAGFVVSGSITVNNPNKVPVAVTVAAPTGVSGAVCTLTGAATVNVAAAGSASVGYSCAMPSGTSASSTGNLSATVTWPTTTLPGTTGTTTATNSFNFANATPAVTDQVVNIVDTAPEFAAAFPAPANQVDAKVVLAANPASKTFSYSRNLGSSVAGGTCESFPNTASVPATSDQAKLDAKATVEVCAGQNLTISKLVVSSLHRTYDWNLAKDATATTVAVGADGKATFNYTVTATPGSYLDDRWAMTGKITVTNPNAWPVTADIADTTSFGTNVACTVTGGDDAVIPARSGVVNGTLALDYSCTFTGAPNELTGSNTASATWDADAAGSPAATTSYDKPIAESDWSMTLHNQTITVTDDKAGLADPNPETLGTATWNAAGTPTVFNYSLTVDGPVTPGTCREYKNTAAITGLSDTAEETVSACSGVGEVTKTVVSTTQNANLSWTIVYELSVTNTSASYPLHYDLSDTFAFGTGVSVVSSGITTAPAGVSVNPGWNGGTDDGIATGVTLAATGTHLYRLSATVTADASVDGAQLTCTTGGPGAFANTTGLTFPGGSDSAEVCSAPASPTVTKTANPATQDPATGNWNISYQVTVTNPSQLPLAYHLSDTPAALPSGVSQAGGWSISGPVKSPADAGDFTAPGTAWDGAANTAVGAGTLPVGASHSFTVSGAVSLGEAVDNSDLLCPAGGIKNGAVVTNQAGGDSADACVPITPGAVTVTKDDGVVKQLADFTWQIDYPVKVTNNSGFTTTYTLTDAPQLGAGWTQLAGTGWLAPAPVAGKVILNNTTHTYYYRVIARFDTEHASPSLTCDDQAGGAFFNTAKVTYPGGQGTDSGCAEPGRPTVTKTALSTTQDAQGNWVIKYQVAVTNQAGIPLAYRLSDNPAGLPSGTSLVGAWSLTGPVTTGTATHSPSVPSWNGDTQTEVGKGTLEPGATQTFTVTGTVRLDQDVETDNLLCSEGGGIRNTAAVTNLVGGNSQTVCTDIVPGTVSIAKGNGVVSQQADFTWKIVYPVTVSNPSTRTVVYELTDTPDFGAGFDVVSNGWVGAPATEGIVLPAGETDDYSYEVVASFDPSVTSPSLTCTEADGGAFFNSATVTFPGGSAADVGCGEPAKPSVTKTALATTQNPTTGNWTISYEVKVTNGATIPLAYSLSDNPAGLPDGTSLVGDWTVTGPVKSPAAAGEFTPPADTWNGTSQAEIGLGTLPAGASHTFTVTGTIALGNSVDNADLLCVNQGFKNTAAVTNIVGGNSGTVCAEIVPGAVTVDKGDGVVTQLSDFSWQIDYPVTVANNSGKTAVYTLSDDLDLGTGFTVVTKGWFGAQPVPNTPLATGESDEFSYRVVATFDSEADSPELTCDLTDGGAFFNSAAVSFPGGSDSDTGCAEPASPTVAKTGSAAQQNADGSWTISYQVKVTNPSTMVLAYAVDDDAAALPAGVTAVGFWTAAGPSEPEGTSSLNGNWNGTGELATGLLPAGRTHTFTLTRKVSVAPSVTDATLTCTDGGLWNTAKVDNGVGGNDSDACVSIVRPTVTVSKTETGTTHLVNGQWQITYVVLATNSSQSLIGLYDLTDTLMFGGDIDVESATWTGRTTGTFPASGTATLATGETIAAGAEHVYTVTVLASIDQAAWTSNETLQCVSAEVPEAGGFLNTATLTNNGQDSTRFDCSEPALPTIVKDATGAVQDPVDATKWLVSYVVRVTSGGIDTFYDLADTPDFPSEISLISGTAQRTDVTSPEQAITTGTKFVVDQPLLKGETHTYRVTWLVDVADSYEPEQKCEADHGFYNSARLTVGEVNQDEDACIPVTPRVYPSVAKSVTSTTQGADGKWTVSYDVTVTLPSGEQNPSGLAAEYDLTDTLDFGSGITIDSASWTGPGGTGGVFAADHTATLASDQTITVATNPHHYTVTAIADVATTAFDNGTARCAANEAGSGFLNTAELTSGTTTTTDDACAEPAKPVVTKTGEVAEQNADGSWTISYLVAVSNDNEAGPRVLFNLFDTPAALPAGVTLTGGWTAAVIEGPAVSNGNRPETGDWLVASGFLEPGASASYRIQAGVRVALAEEPFEFESCRDTESVGIVLPNSAKVTSGQVEGADDGCTTVLPPQSWTLAKTANPTTGSTVLPGQTIIYTLRVVNTGQVPVTGATVNDDLSDVLDNATLAGSLPAELTQVGNSLKWSVPTIPVGGYVTVNYSVTVNPAQFGVMLRNHATPGDNGTCVPEPTPRRTLAAVTVADPCSTEHPTPAWTLVKTTSPADGSAVLPGDEVTYTLVAKNTSAAQLSGAWAIDELAGVLNHADLVGELGAGLSLTGTQLTWTLPTLAPGAEATATYTVKVRPGAYGVALHNVVTPFGEVPPAGCPAEDRGCRETDHYVQAWTLAKTSNPVPGTVVEPGQVVTYTLTATNTGPTAITTAMAIDDLTGVLANASLVQPLAAGLSTSGTSLTWAIPAMGVGETRTVSYQVRIAAEANDASILNTVRPGDLSGTCPTSCSTQHRTPVVDDTTDDDGNDLDDLAYTGATGLGAGAVGLGLFGIGLLAVLVSRRRRSDV
ncbi:MAG TPA: hypothetical protein PKV13_08745 [Propionicimonas sp.]|nr:hypothetical protein [Propionicimonas sp.]